MSIAHKFEDRARTNDVLISETVDFPGLLLSKPVLKGLADGGFLKPSPIQLKAIPLGRCGLDLIVQAKSGTGKTCVFTVVALESVDITSPSLQVLVLAPTREIAQQIQGVIREIGSAMPGLKCHTFIGGLPILQDKILCKNCHIAVGTPGRVKQLLEIGALKANSIRLFVLDEADKLLENSFQESINWIYSSLPENKQILALSATYPEYLADHLTRYMRNPTFVRLNAADPALLGIKQYHAVVPHHTLPNFVFSAKTEMVVKIISSVSFQQCLIFSNMQTRAQDLQSELQARNWPTACIAGCLQQQERSFAMDQLKSYKCRILISTDLTSRGIDADKVNLVINLDVPPDHETYLHRIGRAGRFGSFGAAITIVSKGIQEKDLWRIEKLCKTYIHPLPDPLPNDLVARPVPVRLDDVVSTEQIITKPGSVTPEDFTEPRKTQPETEIADTSSEDTQASMLSERPFEEVKEDCLGSQDSIGDMHDSSVNTFQDSAETDLHSGRSLLLLEKKYELQQNLSVTENGGKEDEILIPSEICDGGKQSFAQSDMTVNGQKVLAVPEDIVGSSDQHPSLSKTTENHQLSKSVSTTCVNNQDSSSPDRSDSTQQLLLCGENSTALQQTGDSELEDTLLSGQGVNSRGDSSCLMSPVKIQQILLSAEAEIHDPNTVSSKCQGVAKEVSVSQSATSDSVVNVSNNHLVSSTLSQDGDIDSQIDLDSVPSTACDDQETWTNDSLSETEKKEGDRNADNDEQETVNDIDQGETDETLSKSANSMNKDNYPCESANDQQVEAQSYNDVTETCSSMKADEIKNNNGAKTQSINETTQPCIPVKVDENEINNSAETSKDSASETCILTEPDESGTENGAKAQPTNDATDSDISTKAGQSKTINGAETQITDVTTEPCISLETDESESKNDDVADSCLSVEAGESITVNGAKTQSNSEAMDLGTSTDADECKATYGANERSENGTKTQSNSDVTDSCILTKADECGTEYSAEYGIENGIKTQSIKDNTEPCMSLETDESVWKDVVGTQSDDDDDDDDVTGVCFSIQADESVIENGAETEPNCDTTNPSTFIEANECGNKNVTTSDLCLSSISIIEGDLGGEKTSFKTDSPGCPLSEKSDRNEQSHDVSNGENPKGEPMYSQNFQLESERDQPVQSFIHALNPYVDNRNLSEVNPSDKTSIYLDFNNGNKKFVGCDSEMEQNVLFVDEQFALRDRNIWKDVEVNAEDSDNGSDPELCVDSTQECKVNHGLHLSDFTSTGKEAASADIESFNVQEDVKNAKDLTNNISNKDEQIEATMGVASLNSIQSTSTDQPAPLEMDKTGTIYNEEYKTYSGKSGNINPDGPTQNLQGENLSLDVPKCKNIEGLSKTSGSSSSSPGPAAKAKRKPPSRNFAVASFLEQLRSENENLSTLALAKSNILNTCKEDVITSDTVDNIEESSPEAGLLGKNLSNLTEEEEVQNIATPEVPSPEALSVRSPGKVTGENRSNSSTITKSKSYARSREDKRLSPASKTNHSDESTKAIAEHDVFDSDVIDVQKDGANVEIVDQDSESKVDIPAETDVVGSKKSSDSSSNSPSLIYSILEEERNSKNQPSFHDLENSLQMFKETYDDATAKIPPKAISIFQGDENFSEDPPELQAYCKEETERLKSIKKLLIEKKQNVTKERQVTSQATSNTSTPSKQSSESASEKKTPVRFKGPLPQEASSFEKALYEHVKARHRKDEGEVSSPDVLTQEESSESSVDVQQEKSPAKPVEDMQDKQVRHDVPSNEECKKLDDMHEEMLRKRKLRKANKKLETVAKEGQTGEGKLNQVMLSPNASLQYVSNDSASVDSSNQLQPFVEKQNVLHDEKDVTYNQTKIAVEEYSDKNLTKRVNLRKGKQVLSQNSEAEEEDKNSEASPCMKSYIENVIYEQDDDTENECKNSPIRALRTSSKTAIHNQSNEAENKGRNRMSGSETKSKNVVDDENFTILLSNDTGMVSEGTPTNGPNVRHPGIQTSAKKSLTPLFNAIHRKQLSSTKSKSQRIKQNPELKSLQICQRSPLKTLMVAQPDDDMLRYSSPEADNRSLKDNASKSIQNTPKKGKEVRAKIKQKNTREKVKEQGRGSQTRKDTYVSPGEMKPIKPSKSAARQAGLDVSDGSTSSSSSETNSTSSTSLKKKDPKSKKKIYASASQAAASGRNNHQDNESTSATSDSSDDDDFSYDMNKYFPYYPKYPSKVQSQHYPWYQPNPQRTAHPTWQQYWPSPGFNYTHSHTNSANRFHPHYLPSGMASMQPIHHPYYQYYHDYYSQYYPQYFHPVTHPPHPSLWSGYSVRDRQPQPYDSCYRAQSLPHSVEASMQWEYVCHMTQQSVRMGKKFRKSMKLRKS